MTNITVLTEITEDDLKIPSPEELEAILNSGQYEVINFDDPDWSQKLFLTETDNLVS